MTLLLKAPDQANPQRASTGPAKTHTGLPRSITRIVTVKHHEPFLGQKKKRA